MSSNCAPPHCADRIQSKAIGADLGDGKGDIAVIAPRNADKYATITRNKGSYAGFAGFVI
ncbi:protein of unknown function [Methylocella tundrae]|uniref:Uncharacterized protein n=1 Tax=Methylocella tundrae TaxID=227605 RepID=A0A4U8Z1U3_METTU|nr:protein of unknown function [Methylocella tundrae]